MENNNEFVDGSIEVKDAKEANRLLKEHGYRVQNGGIDSFVSLKGINKVYPNGVQAVYDFNLDIDKHDFIVLVGPSGCGKSTTLRMVAGLEDISSGYLYIDKILSNYLPSKSRDISMVFQSYALYPQMSVYENIAFPLRIRKYKKQKRDNTLVALNEVLATLDNGKDLAVAIVNAYDRHANFGKTFEYLSTRFKISDDASKIIIALNVPHNNVDAAYEFLTAKKESIKVSINKRIEAEVNKNKSANLVLDNEYYYLNEKGERINIEEKLSEEEIRRKVFEAAKILDLGPYLDRLPKELSGGQMQRVALGRAIVRNAKVFLMDEPLSNLDAKLRVTMRSEIVRIHETIGATTIYVTHDQTEAMTMATKIVVMSKGWVQQVGTPHEVYSKPKNLFVATFIGSPSMNIFDATVKGDVVTLKDGFSVKLGKEFKKNHQEFYERKVAETKRLIRLLNNENEYAAMRIIEPINDYIGKQNPDKLKISLAKNEFKRLADLISTLKRETVDLIDASEIQNKHSAKVAVEGACNALSKDINLEIKKIPLAEEKVKAKIQETFSKISEFIDVPEISAYKEQIAKEADKAYYNADVDLAGNVDNAYLVKQLTRMKDCFDNHQKENKDFLIASIDTLINAINDDKDVLKALEACYTAIHKVLTITEADLSKIYSAKSYIKSDKDNKVDVISYAKPNKKKKAPKVKKGPKAIDPRETKILLEGMLHEYESALSSEHLVKFGIRPEDLHIDSIYKEEGKTKPFIIEPNVVELLGGELLIHADYNDVDLIAKIPANVEIKSHEKAALAMDGNKIHIFDSTSGERIDF